MSCGPGTTWLLDRGFEHMPMDKQRGIKVTQRNKEAVYFVFSSINLKKRDRLLSIYLITRRYIERSLSLFLRLMEEKTK